MIKAAAYARYSTDKQQNNSIIYQMEAIAGYCKKNKLKIVKEYADPECTGTNMDRPNFTQLREDARAGLFDVVVVYDISRGSRDVGDWFTFRKEMMYLGVQVVTTQSQVGDPLDGNAFLHELLSVGLGHKEVLDGRLKSRAGVKAKAQEGVFLGGQAPLGYKIVEGHYIVKDSEAAAVKRIFELYGAGASYNAIIDEMQGTKTRRGRPIGKNSLHSILTNERYIGVYTWNKRIMKVMHKWAGGKPNPDVVRIENAIPAIIDMETWEAVQKRMRSNKRAQNKAKRRDYLLTGLIECEACGASYVGHTSTSQKGYQTSFYTCGGKYRTRTCTAKNVNAAELESFVIAHLREYLRTHDFTELAEAITEQLNASIADCTKEKEELVQVERQIHNGIQAILSGMALDELREEVDRLKVRKSELQDIIAAAGGNVRVDISRVLGVIKQAARDVDENPKAAVKMLVQKIYAYPDGSCTVEVGVHLNGCGGRI